jgi:hypothetical protein
MNSKARDDRLNERKPRLRSIPADEVVDRTAIASLRFWGPQADEHRCFGVLPICLSSFSVPFHGRRLPTAGHEMAPFDMPFKLWTTP